MNVTKFRIAIVCVLISTSGCLGRSLTPTYYTMSSLAPVTAPPQGTGPAIGVGPAELPAYLDRPHIATRRGSELGYDEYRRWGGGLEAELLRVLGANLARELNTDRVAVYPVEPAYPLDVRVVLDVERFEGSLGGAVALDVRWVLTSGRGGEALGEGHTSIRQPVGSDQYGSLIEAHSIAVGTLGAKIATQIRGLDD